MICFSSYRFPRSLPEYGHLKLIFGVGNSLTFLFHNNTKKKNGVPSHLIPLYAKLLVAKVEPVQDYIFC